MVNHCHLSLDPLLQQLQDYGKFSKRIPADSSGVKEISDYMFSELLTNIKENRIAHTGILFDIDCSSHRRISISTVMAFNAKHVKSFPITKSELESFFEYLDHVTRVYTHLFIQRPRFSFQELTVLYREEAS